MSWTEVLLDVRVFLLPFLVLIAALALALLGRFSNWTNLFHVQVLIIAICTGLVWGPGALARMIGSQVELSLDWAAFINVLWLSAWFLAMVFALRSLRELPLFTWIPYATVGYNIGWFIHAGLTWGTPVMETLGGQS